VQKNFKKVVTMVELLVVVAMLGILALLAVPRYLRGMEQSRDAEIQSLLRLVATAERVYQQERYQYIGCIDTADCSAILDLDLQSNDWDYSVSVPGAGSFIATAQRTGGPDAGRRWEMTESDDSPTCLNGDLCP